MPRTVNIVVTCTQRKVAPAHPRLQAANLKAKTSRGRVVEWITRIEGQRGIPIPAIDLYAGDTWSVVRTLIQETPSVGIRPVLWICSAGYGLVRHTAPVHPYAATFSRVEQDTITREHPSETPKEQCQSWWAHLTNWPGPVPDQPRSLAAVAAQNPKTPILFAGSQAYFDAMEGDLLAATKNLASPDLLSLVSAGTTNLNGLSQNLLPCDARYQLELGGARQSLNVRLLHMLLLNHSHTLTASALSEALVDNEENLEDLPTYDRSPASDDQVREFIKKSLLANPAAKHSPLLREFRDSGFKAEQSRFRNLFKSIQVEIHGK